MEKPRIIEFQHVMNRGASIDIAASDSLPFKVKRIFWISGVEHGAVRGEHAHKTSKQIVVVLRGKIEIELSGVDGLQYAYTLESTNQGVYIPPLFWGKIIFSENTVLLTMASDNYEESDYIRNYEEFLTLK